MGVERLVEGFDEVCGRGGGGGGSDGCDGEERAEGEDCDGGESEEDGTNEWEGWNMLHWETNINLRKENSHPKMSQN